MTESRICVECGAEFIATQYKQNTCSEKCREAHRQKWEAEYKHPKRPRMTKKEIKRLERIAHQQDTTIWTHDYAERQKAKTLEIVGRIL